MELIGLDSRFLENYILAVFVAEKASLGLLLGSYRKVRYNMCLRYIYFPLKLKLSQGRLFQLGKLVRKLHFFPLPVL